MNSFHVGVVLDLRTSVGKTGRTSVSMAIDDFYGKHSNYTTRLVVHTLDSNNDVVRASSAGSNELAVINNSITNNLLLSACLPHK